MRDKYGQILSVITGADLVLYVAALLVFILGITLASLRLKWIVEAQTISVTFLEATSLTFIGYFFNNFLPTAIGGDVVKAHYLSKHSGKTAASYTSVFVDRAIGLVTMVFMAFVALLFAGSKVVDVNVRYAIYGITAASAAGVFLLAHKGAAKKFTSALFFMRPLIVRFEDRIRHIYGLVNSYRANKILMVQALGISVVSQLFYFASIGLLAASIGSRISSMELLLRLPIVAMMSLLPSINGLGLREGAIVVLFGPLMGNENAFAVGILNILVLLITSLAGGLIYLLSPQFKVKLREVKAQEAI